LRKLFPIALLFFIGFSQAGYYVFSIGYQLYLKEQMREAVLKMADRKELVCISYTDHQSEIEWEEKGKEFSFKHEMYDVAFTDTVNGKILLYCADDNKETALIAHYNAVAKNNSPSNKKNSSLTFKMTDLYCINSTVPPFNLVLSPFNFFKYNSVPLTGISSIASPPPKLFS
jgi:hypothetical protein